jgi:ribose transport system ATP-binding protein
MSPLLEARGVSKAFPGVQALAEVNLRAQSGEVLAVVGENGAGKSTLMKILAGVHAPDAGEILWEGQSVQFSTVKAAEHRGIVLIHQELNLAPDLDVAGNIFLGREPTLGGWLGLIRSRIYDEAQVLMQRLGLHCSPRDLVSELTIGQQQLVEIARALSLRSRLLILDEPTSSLSERETLRLFEVLRDLKNAGLSIVYISHRLKEVEAIADRVTVLRDGRNAGELTRQDIRHEAIVRLMVGRELKQFYQRHRAVADAAPTPVVEIDKLRWTIRQLDGVRFKVAPGEIVGVAGLMGAGRTELAETIFGVRPALTGEIRVDGAPRVIRKARQAIAAGIFLVPEDRRVEGLVLSDSVKNNISLASLDRLSSFGLVRRREEESLAQRMVETLRIRTPNVRQTVGLLSGGNQQKVVLAKWLARQPRLLILDEPTRGIDVGAKSEIYALMDQLTQQGIAILMISSDLEEILGMSDRVLVMHENRLAGIVPRAKMTEEAIMHLATGGKDAS